jgi:hypothetical protein
MKKLYTKNHIIFLGLLIFFVSVNAGAQCPNSGTPGSTAFDTTIAFGTALFQRMSSFRSLIPKMEWLPV